MLQVEDTPLPEALGAYLGYIRIRIAEELAWLRGSPLYTVMEHGGGGSRAPGDKALLEVRGLSSAPHALRDVSCLPADAACMRVSDCTMLGTSRALHA